MAKAGSIVRGGNTLTERCAKVMGEHFESLDKLHQECLTAGNQQFADVVERVMAWATGAYGFFVDMRMADPKPDPNHVQYQGNRHV